MEVPALGYRELLREPSGESSAAVRRRVLAARAIQVDRVGAERRDPANARLGPEELRRAVPLDGRCRALLERAVTGLGLSARAHDRALRVARTLADLEGTETVRSPHLAEAIHYRTLDRPAE